VVCQLTNRILLVGVIGILAQHWAKHIDMFTIVLVVAVYVPRPN
jgi:hypothetical protein